MKIIIISICTSLMFLVSCSDDDNITKPSSVDLLPLAIGNWWEYNQYEYDSETETIGVLRGSARLEVVGKTEIEGKTTYQIKQTVRGISDTIHYSTDEGNIYTGIVDPSINSRPFVGWFKLYDSNNDVWESMNYEYLNGIEAVGTGSYEGSLKVNMNGSTHNGIIVKQLLELDDNYIPNGNVTEYQILEGVGIYQSILNSKAVMLPDRIEILSDYDVSN